MISLSQKDSKRKFDAQDVFVSWNIPKNIQEAVKLKAAASETTTTSTSFLTSTSSSADNAPEVELTPPGDLVYKRYYHLFKQGELDELVSRSNTAKILESGYDRDNWYIIAEKLE